MNLISRWSAGSWFTYNPNNVPGIEYNVRYKNNYNVDLKFSKVFALGKANVKLYADILNVLNTKTFSGYGFEDGFVEPVVGRIRPLVFFPGARQAD